MASTPMGTVQPAIQRLRLPVYTVADRAAVVATFIPVYAARVLVLAAVAWFIKWEPR